MQVRLAFVLGWFASYLTRRPPTIPESLSLETNLLREEIQAAREAVDSLGEARRSCEWEVWSQRWLLRIGGLVDLILILWIVWARFPLKQSDYPKLRPVVADTVESSLTRDCQLLRPCLPASGVAVEGKDFSERIARLDLLILRH